MSFTKLLIQSTFDKITRPPKKDCPAPNCIIYPTPPCKSMPPYLPQQVPPYYDTIDPNSITKYRLRPTTCKEEFVHSHPEPSISITVLILVIVVVVVVVARQ